eukprot:6155919-Pleurochrysis_carterae.AAC.2
MLLVYRAAGGARMFLSRIVCGCAAHAQRVRAKRGPARCCGAARGARAAADRAAQDGALARRRIRD